MSLSNFVWFLQQLRLEESAALVIATLERIWMPAVVHVVWVGGGELSFADL